MKNIWTPQRTEYLFLFLILSVGLLLFFANLGNHYLWQDEAQTALISKTILKNGVPLAYDGRNFFSQELMADYAKNYIWKLHTWLPFYVLAGFFKIFGVSTFVARLPFALFGMGTVFLTYFFCKTLWQSRKIAATAAFLLLISVPFLILSRQCRYYSMSAFFSLYCLYAYLGLIDKKKYACVTFVISSVLLFHTHYIYCATLLLTVAFHAALFHRTSLKTLLLLTAAVVLINVPWIVWSLSTKYGIHAGFSIKPDKLVKYAVNYFLLIARHIFSPWLLLIIPFAFLGNRLRTKSFFATDRLFWQKLSLLVFFIFFNYVILIIASPWYFFRYLTPLIPPFIIIIALLVVAAARLHIIVAIGIIAVLIFTGSLKDFFYEITHDYDGPLEGIALYLNRHGSADDVVLINYGDMPLKFYTSMRIVGGMTGENLADAADPDWIILRKYLPSKMAIEIAKFVQNNISLRDYRRIYIDYPDICYENREAPAIHHFRTVLDEEKVHFYRKIH